MDIRAISVETEHISVEKRCDLNVTGINSNVTGITLSVTGINLSVTGINLNITGINLNVTGINFSTCSLPMASLTSLLLQGGFKVTWERVQTKN